MNKLHSRQVHLDFHTSELIPNIGENFSKENFQKALKLGNINSITLFAKCHHSWCYYPSKVGKMHPNLNFDLLGEQIKAAHEIGVNAPIYITVGWSANDAKEHPEWLARNKDKSINVDSYDVNAKSIDKKPYYSWENLCPNIGYAKHIYDLTQEVCDRYDIVDGLFYDICFRNPVCYCDDCVAKMKDMGLNPDIEADAIAYYTHMRIQFMKKCTEILHKKNPDGTIFFNGGANIYEPQWHEYQTHFEMEDLPTTWGGYDVMPPRAKYFSKTGKEYLGMTGKFHTAWGEFGGFKNPEALKFECSAMLSYGAKCSVGDQCHPSGEMDLETYRTIGEAYDYVEEIEEFSFDAKETTRLGVMLSTTSGYKNESQMMDLSDEGLIKILLEKQLDFDIALKDDDFSRFDVIILPDNICLNEELSNKLNQYVKNGGGLLLSGDSGLDITKSKFLIEMGIEYVGKSEYDIDYVKPLELLSKGIVKTPFLFYDSANMINVKDENIEILGEIYTPFFNRTYGKYCSHQSAPNKLVAESYPSTIKNGRIVYCAHKICKIYNEFGAQYHRDYFINALNLIYMDKKVCVEMKSSGRISFVKQEAKNRYVLHLLYATPIKRGIASVIEDLPTIYNIPVEVKIEENVKSIRIVPQNENIEFETKNGKIVFNVPQIKSHQTVVINY